MRHISLSTFVLPLLLQLCHAGTIGYSDLPTCAHDCALEYSGQVSCYLPTNELCMCNSIQLLHDAYQCTIPSCANESAQTQKIVEDWFNMVCETGSDDTLLGKGFGTSASTSDPTPVSSSTATNTKASSAHSTGKVKTSEFLGSSNSTTGGTSGSDKSGIGTGGIAGIVGAVVGVLVIAVGIWLWKRSHSKPKPTEDVLPTHQWPGTRYEIGEGETSTLSQKPRLDMYEVEGRESGVVKPSELPANYHYN